MARILSCAAIGIWSSALAMVSVGTAAAQTLTSDRALVLPFSVTVDGDVPGGDAAAFWLGEAAAVLLTDEYEARGLTVLSRAERVAAFSSLQLPLTAPLTRATMIRIAELVGATELVVGDVRLGTRLDVSARVIRLESAHQRAHANADGASNGMYEVMSQVASRLTGRAAPTSLPRMPLAAFELYVKGLVATTPAVQQRLLEGARQQVPGDDRVLLALWEFHHEQADHETALAAANAVGSTARLTREARFAGALSLIELRRFDEAFERLQTLHDEQSSPVIFNALGVIQMRRGSTPETGQPTSFFTQAVNAAPDDPVYLFNLGYAFAKSRNTDSALHWLREVVRFAPADGDAHLVMSQVLEAADRHAEAQRELDLARQLGTSLDSAAVVLSSRVSTGLERLPSKVVTRPAARVQAAIANPAQREQHELAKFHLTRGRRLFDQEDDRGATQELRRAIYLRPYDDEPHLLLGQIYRRGGRLPEAIDAFRIAAWARDSVTARMRLAEALHEIGDTKAALEEARKAVTLDPNSQEAKDLLAKIGGRM